MWFGLWSHRSTETAVSVFLETTKNFLEKSSCVRVIVLDLKRGFDTIDHKILLTKLTNNQKQCCGQQCQIPLPWVSCRGPTRLHTWTCSFLALYKWSIWCMQKQSYTNVNQQCSNMYSCKNHKKLAAFLQLNWSKFKIGSQNHVFSQRVWKWSNSTYLLTSDTLDHWRHGLTPPALRG